ncbi:Uridine kinase [Aduncisulcus paluster]|uniref:Uridine kinase n=1 Tax=Aduncisulcus paluster TaxID=2918883 RepID=A0ABQ5KPY5_9EUKA|nr:Uridine kinase [Aduncisulcus paluster]
MEETAVIPTVKVNISSDKAVTVPVGTLLSDFVAKEFPAKEVDGKPVPVYGAFVNNQVTSLMESIQHDCNVDPIYGDSVLGAVIYRRSLAFLVEMASRSIFPDRILIQSHTMSRAHIFYFDGEDSVSEDDIKKIEDAMKMLVGLNLPVTRSYLPFSSAVAYLEKAKMPRSVEIIAETNNPTVSFSQCLCPKCGTNFRQLWLGPVLPTLGLMDVFKCRKNELGFTVQYPGSSDPTKLMDFSPRPNLVATYKEHRLWCKTMGILGVGYLNKAVHEHRVKEFIHISEAKHDRQYAAAAESVAKHNKRLICLAGPSSSGKTTSAQKISVFLKSYGLKPVLISLDNYYLDHDDPRSPRDEKGNHNFEVVEALDHELLNHQMKQLIDGEEVEIPIFNFRTGKRDEKGFKLKLPPKGVIFIEGINSHDDRCSSHIPPAMKIKLFVCPLTVVDRRIMSPMDVRLIRRICRDALFRGTPASGTIKMWPDVRRAEKRHIFSKIDSAQVVINTALDYEMCVMKVFAIPLLRAIPVTDPTYGTARELISALDHFASVPAEFVPERCVLREFLPGGSVYKEFFEE